MAAGKMSGSPYHVETATYKYAVEKSEVPVKKSEFNQTITNCSQCAYCYDVNHEKRLCLNISGANLGGSHCEGFLSVKSIPNIMVFKNESLEEYYSFQNRKLINVLISLLKGYKPGSIALVDFYYQKKWVFTGINKSFSKDDLFRLVDQLNGKHWSHKEHWDLADSDIVINMGGGPYKLKMFRREVRDGKYEGKKLPFIIPIQDLRKDIRKMISLLRENK